MCPPNHEVLKTLAVEAGYGKKKVLKEVTFEICVREIVGLVGPNGSGKSTILKALYGLIPVDNGTIIYLGKEIQNRPPRENLTEGICYFPQINKVFGKLSVNENLEMGGYILEDSNELKTRIQNSYEMFPILKKFKSQPAGKLSGGERQMLSLAMGLIVKPTLMLLDEPSVGLAPKIIDSLFQEIRELNQKLGTTILIVEQNVRQLLKITSRTYVLKLGHVVFEERRVDDRSENNIRQYFFDEKGGI
jgi:ABC-type branched-subunit amino acid transport system ATPase component